MWAEHREILRLVLAGNAKGADRPSCYRQQVPSCLHDGAHPYPRWCYVTTPRRRKAAISSAE